ncbi:hypothetical protein ACFSTC_39705 [Nonomuraea ferruginea]
MLNTRYTLDDEVQSVSFPAAGGLAEESVVYTYDELAQPTRVAGLSPYVSAARYSKMGDTLQYELGEGGREDLADLHPRRGHPQDDRHPAGPGRRPRHRPRPPLQLRPG